MSGIQFQNLRVSISFIDAHSMITKLGDVIDKLEGTMPSFPADEDVADEIRDVRAILRKAVAS